MYLLRRTSKFLFALALIKMSVTMIVAAETMTINEVRSWGSDAHPAVRQAQAEWHAVRGDWIQAGLGENPQIGWVADTIGSGGSAGQQGVGLEKTFTPATTLSARQQVAAQQAQAKQYAYEIARCRASADVTLLAQRIAFAQQRLTCYARLIAAVEKSLVVNEKRLAAQEISRAEFLQEKLELNRRTMAKRQEEERLRGLQQQLTLLLGREMRGIIISPPEEIASGRIPREINVSEMSFLASSPEMQQCYAEIKVAHAELARSRAENCRQVSAATQLLYDTETRESVVSLGVMIPLRTTNRNQGNILASRQRMVASQYNAERVRLAIQSRLAEKYAEYDAAYATWEQYQKSILLDARQMLHLMTQSYSIGECTSLEVLIAQQTLAEVELEYLNALEQLFTIRAELEHSLLSGALE